MVYNPFADEDEDFELATPSGLDPSSSKPKPLPEEWDAPLAIPDDGENEAELSNQEEKATLDLDRKEALTKAVHYSVGKLCREEEKQMDVGIPASYIAALSRVVMNQIEVWGKDLEAFAKHRGKIMITPEDVKLLARRNPDILNHLNHRLAAIRSQAKGGKGKSKSKESPERPRKRPVIPKEDSESDLDERTIAKYELPGLSD